MNERLIKISKPEAAKRRKLYMRSHPFCLAPVQVGMKWEFCLGAFSDPHHLARGRGYDLYEVPANYYPLGAGLACNHHGKYAHAVGNTKPFAESNNRLDMFAIKLIMGEAVWKEIEFLMNGRSWWRPEMGREQSLEREITLRAIAWEKKLKKVLATKGGLLIESI